MNFGDAIVALKSGYKVYRSGWNGKGMWLAYQPGYLNGTLVNKNSQKAYGLEKGTTIIVRPYIAMKTANDEFVPWVASQSDILAEDWHCIKE